MMGNCQGICSQVCLRLFFHLTDYQMLFLMLNTVCLTLDYKLRHTGTQINGLETTGSICVTACYESFMYTIKLQAVDRSPIQF